MMGAMAPNPRVGTTIRRARLSKRWTQHRLAEALNVSLRTVNDWENDRAYPRNPVALEEVLGISLDDDDSGYRVISPALRRMVMETLKDPADQRRVLGLLEGTLTWPERSGDGNQEQHPAAG
jgi:transcriptional regulator with XRE-family HTH domain